MEFPGPFVSVDQMAEILGVSRRHVYQLQSDGVIPAIRVGRALRFSPSEVIESLRVPAGGPVELRKSDLAREITSKEGECLREKHQSAG